MNKLFASRLGFITFSSFMVLSAALAVLAYSYGGVDFGVYYAAGRVLLHGGNPYDYAQLSKEIVSVTGKLNNPYYYAPWFTWFALPFSLLSFHTARLCWAVTNYVLWIWSLFTIDHFMKWNLAAWKRWGMYLLATIIFAWATWGSEQAGILILFLLTLLLFSFEKGQWAWMGVWMSLLLFKPNITAFPILMLVVWLAFRKQWRPVIYMIVTLCVLSILSLMITPGWYLALLQPDKLTGLSYTLNAAGGEQVLRYSSTLHAWLAAYGVTGFWAVFIQALAIFLVLGVSLWLVRRADSIVEFAAYIFLANFIVTPYALFYDYVALTLTLFFVNAELAQQRSLNWLRYSMNLLLAVSLLIGENISYRYWMIVILSGAVVVAAGRKVLESKPALESPL